MSQAGLSFEDALSESEELLCELEDSGEKEDLKNRLSTMLSSLPSCRGFFVTFLTGDSKLSDNPPEFMLELMRQSPHVPELLTKNLVMSVTMRIAHEREGASENSAGSALVARRTADLIGKTQTPELRLRLNEMRSSIKTRAGIFADFLSRWAYDQEQLAAAEEAVAAALRETKW